MSKYFIKQIALEGNGKAELEFLIMQQNLTKFDNRC